ADGRRIPRPEAHVADHLRRLYSRKHLGHDLNFGPAQRFRLRTAVWHVSRHGCSAGGIFRNADCILVSGIASGAMILRGAFHGAASEMISHVAPRVPGVQPFDFGFVAGGLVVLLLVLLLFAIVVRKLLRKGTAMPEGEFAAPIPDPENASAFMAASMQGVIEKLRTQEKELARLHLVAQERAQESERLTEEVTRNMPTGLLLVNATGAISSTNPAAEAALGIRTLRYRSYKEILGAESELTQMLTACIRDGKTFQRGEIEHLTSEGAVRNLGVTISPIYRAARASGKSGVADNLAHAKDPHAQDMKISGALCLMSDLTELTALQKQIRWKEN